MNMCEMSQPWIGQGFPKFDAGPDGFPCPGQVLRHFRQLKCKPNGRHWTQRDLAHILGKQELAVREMELRDIGLDDISRRRLLVGLLDIPPQLLGLAVVPEEQETTSTFPNWLVQQQFPKFDAGPDGFPCPGQVLRHFRQLKCKPNGRPWTQRDLAHILGKQELAVREMELRDTGLNDISRRRFLVHLLDIPPVLLGLAASPLECRYEQEKTSNLPKQKQTTYIPRETLSNQEKLFTYQRVLPSYWNAYFTTNPSDALQKIRRVLTDLQRLSPYILSDQKHLATELLCHYHQLALDMSRDQGKHEMALSQASLAITLAERFERPELLVSAFYRRGLTYFDTGNHTAAFEDLNYAASFAQNRDFQLQGMVFLEAGRFLAHIARERVQTLQVHHWLERTERLFQEREAESDGCYVHLDKGRVHIGRAATLLTLRHFTSALDELDLATQLTKTEQVRRHAYIDILRARVHFAQGELDYATELALSALPTCLKLRSLSNIADLARLYHSLKHSSYGDSLLVARFGVLLRTNT